MRFRRIGPALVIAGIVAAGCRETEQEAPVPAAMPEATPRTEHRANARLTPEAPVAREPAEVSVAIEGPSGDVPQLAPIAESDVHLVAVSRDLSWYEHVHPRRNGETWKATMTFPAPGEYVLHTIFRPSSGSQIVQKQVVRVSGTTTGAAGQQLPVSPREQRNGNYTVRLTANPEPPAVSVWNALTFSIARDGKAVTNLVPTGALGHIVILREGGEDFVYAHSTDGEATGGIRGRAHVRATPSESGADHRRHVGDTGPDVTFHTRFPTTGRYRMWVEFRAGDDTIDADFVVDVKEPPPPPAHKD